MDKCACGAQKSEYSYACEDCKERELAESRERVAWINAEKQARWGDYGPLNDLIDRDLMNRANQ